MYDYLNERGYSATNYAKFIKFRGIKQEKVRGYTDEEIEVIAKHKTETARVSMILAYTGLRINEFLSLRKFDINLSDNIIFTRAQRHNRQGTYHTNPSAHLPHIKHFRHKTIRPSTCSYETIGKCPTITIERIIINHLCKNWILI